MKFSFDYVSDVLTLDINGGHIDIGFKDGEAYWLMINNEIELVPEDTCVKSVCVAVEDKTYKVFQVLDEANRQYEGILQETVDEMEAEIEYERDLRSPYLTGRI